METINANARIKQSAHSARTARRNGKIPGILYGKNMQNLMFEVSELELNKEICEFGEHGLININIDGTEHRSLIKEVQRDPSTHELIHIDLEEMTKDKLVQTDVPLIFAGEDNVSRNGGILQKEKTKVRVQCKGDNVINSININVGNLTHGNTFRIRDIEMSSEITIMDDPNTVIASVTEGNTTFVSEETMQISNPRIAEE